MKVMNKINRRSIALVGMLLALSVVTEKLSAQVLFKEHHPVANPVGALQGGTSRDFIPVSPAVASLGIFGQIPVGNYTGTAMVSVPLYEIKYRELSVPISLNYHASGIKPDLLPGPVGLGWTLQAGGCIIRQTRGNMDFEKVEGSKRLWLLDSDDPRGKENWSNSGILKNNLSTNFVTSRNTTDPDEFIFNINGHVGKFMAGHTDTILVQSNLGMQYRVIPSLIYDDNKTTVLGIKGFDMIDMNGIKYLFRDIEKVQPYKLNEEELRYDDNLITKEMGWMLSSVLSPNGQRIDYEYEHNNFFMRSRFSDIAMYKDDFHSDFFAGIDFIYEDTEFATWFSSLSIRKIVFPGGEVIFEQSQADKQLWYPKDYNVNKIPDCFPAKVDEVKVSDSEGNLIKKIRFNYTEDNTTRLKLLSLDISGKGAVEQKYRFEYNQTPLPGYLSLMTDHYGFANGKRLFPWPPDPSGHHTDIVYSDNEYIDRMRQPDFTYGQAEILQKVIYPTGGYTALEYEANDYSGVYHTWPFRVEPLSQNRETGGARIKSISNFDSDGSLLTKKNYYYRKDYLNGGGLSSGVLTYTPKYTEHYSRKFIMVNETQGIWVIDFFRWTTNPVFPMMATRGNHVTYSEVTVEETGNGYTVSKYKNYDNGYQDKEPFNYVANKFCDHKDGTGMVEFWKNEEGISMGLERGQLTSEEIYDARKSLKKRTTYKYNDDEKRFDQHVRYLRFIPTIINRVLGEKSYVLIAGAYYTYFPYLKEKTEEFFLNNSISKKSFYTYYEPYRLPKTETLFTTGSNGDVKSYVYNFESLSENSYYQDMVDSLMVASPIEESLKRGNYNMATVRRKYTPGLSTGQPNLFLLESEEKSIGPGAFKNVCTMPVYDHYGNPKQIITPEEDKLCLLWSYNGQYPVAKIEGLTYRQVSDALTETFIDELSRMNDPDETTIERIRTKLSFLALHVFITTYKYKPLFGLVYEKDPNGLKTSYQYDDFGRLKSVTDNDGNKTVIHEYHYKQ